MTKKIMILGASKPCCSSIKKVKDEGFYVLVADKNHDAPGFSYSSKSIICDIVDKERILEICKQEKVDAIIPINDFGVPTVAYVANKLRLIGISEETAELSTNKEKMREKWIRDGLRCPKAEIGTTSNEIEEAARKIGYPVVLKPAHGVGGGSRGVIVVSSENELEGAVSFSQSFYDDKVTLVESYIDAVVEHSVEAIVYEDEIHILNISDKICPELPYRVSRCITYPTKTEGKKLEDLHQLVKSSIKSLGINVGCAHVELAETKDGDFVLFELGARSGGGATPHPITSYVTGIDMITEYVRIMCGEKPLNLTKTRNMACCYYFLSPSPGKLKEVSGLDEVRLMDNILEADVLIRKGQYITPLREAKDRSGYIISGGNTVEEAVNTAKEAERKIRFIYE